MSNSVTQNNHSCNTTAQWVADLFAQMHNFQQRKLLSCQGTQQWCAHITQIIQTQGQSLIVLSNQTEYLNAVPFAKSETLLGQETGVVIVDLFQGLNADVLCIAAGLVRAGGLLVLLSPGPEHWQQTNDEYAIWQNDRVSPQIRFIDYFFEKINADMTACIRLRQGHDLPAILPVQQASMTALVDGKTGDQANVLEDIDRWLLNPRQRIVLITAHRGRGKSTCLGFIVRRLVEENDLSVCVTAYSRQSAAMLLAQFDTARFSSPDQIIQQKESADVLVIDEAAMLPFAMLEQLCRQFNRIVMATTTGGYEGTGQGFMLRFVAGISENELCSLQLHQPVRWGKNDCLENWLNDTLVLDSSVKPALTKPMAPEFRIFDRKEDEARIIEIYRLMVSAHYRTRPSDLRALMENPDLIPIVAESQQQLPGVALLNREGAFDETLTQQVSLGQRRLKGHLLAQMLTAQAGMTDFASFAGLRIQRIAVTEVRRRQGIGRGLIEFIESFAIENRYDYLGASFAFDSESAGFWQSCGFRLVHLGYGQGKSSGNHSVAVIKIINPALDAKMTQLEDKLRNSLPIWLCQFLQNMNVGNVISLLRYSRFNSELSEIEKNEVRAFTMGRKGFELCFVSLQRAVMQAIALSTATQRVHPWLIEKIVQNRDWNDLSHNPECQGRKSIQHKLRGLVEDLLVSADSDS